MTGEVVPAPVVLEGEIVDELPICGVIAYDCRCGLPSTEAHEVHVCKDSTCGGQWKGTASDREGMSEDFEAVKLPDISKVIGSGMMLVLDPLMLFGDRE